jgi:hypothetical protein
VTTSKASSGAEALSFAIAINHVRQVFGALLGATLPPRKKGG